MYFDAVKSAEVEAVLMNMGGQVVYRDFIMANEGANKFTFTDQNNLPGGVYFFNLVNPDGTMLSQKLIKK